MSTSGKLAYIINPSSVFEFLQKEHGLSLTEAEMDDLIHCVVSNIDESLMNPINIGNAFTVFTAAEKILRNQKNNF